MIIFLVFFFFFQAEDGIRDWSVTGVQTCALPIYIPWHQQYYLHLLGPALQVFDALFIARVFRKPLKAVPALLSVIVLYVAWTELFVQRFNTVPSGNVTSGLPYPFLNNMEWADRLSYYGVNIVVAFGILMTLAALGWMLRPKKPMQPEPEPATQ